MDQIAVEPSSKSRLACLLDQFGTIPDPRDPRYVAHPLREIMFLVVCGILDAGADYLLAVKANQSTIRREIEGYFADAPASCLASHYEADKGHDRIEERTVTVSAETSWLEGSRHFPGELRLPQAKCILAFKARTHLKDHCRADTRYYISSRRLTPQDAAHAVRSHWAIENSLHWTLDCVFHDDLKRNRKGHGAINMAIVRHFAFNLVRMLDGKRSLKNRRK